MFGVVVQAILWQVHKRCLLPRLMESLGEPMTVDEERYLRWKKEDVLFFVFSLIKHHIGNKEISSFSETLKTVKSGEKKDIN